MHLPCFYIFKKRKVCPSALPILPSPSYGLSCCWSTSGVCRWGACRVVLPLPLCPRAPSASSTGSCTGRTSSLDQASCATAHFRQLPTFTSGVPGEPRDGGRAACTLRTAPMTSHIRSPNAGECPGRCLECQGQRSCAAGQDPILPGSPVLLGHLVLCCLLDFSSGTATTRLVTQTCTSGLRPHGLLEVRERALVRPAESKEIILTANQFIIVHVSHTFAESKSQISQV